MDAELEKVVMAFAKIWDRVRKSRPSAATEKLVVDGYASSADPPQLQSALSCLRATSVQNSLTRAIAQLAPGSSPGIDVFARGVTSAFDPAPLRNQRAVISPSNPDGYRGSASFPAAGTGPTAYPGLGARKAALAAAGGNDRDLAVAMLETERMLTDYPFGDAKTKDAANFGIFKQNWYFIRTSGAMPALPGPTLPGQGPLGLDEADWLRGADLNADLALDVSVVHASQAKLGLDQWFAAHRWGASGQAAFLAAAGGSPDSRQRALIADIANYRGAVEWILGQIGAHPVLRTNDTKMWVDVPAV